MLDVHLIKQSTYRERLKKTRTLMQEEGIDAICVVPRANLNYLAGCELDIEKRFCLAIFPLDEEPLIVAPLSQEGRAKKATSVSDIRIWTDDEDPIGITVRAMEERRLSKSKIGLDQAMWWEYAYRLQEVLPRASFVECGRILNILRMTKSNEEISTMKTAIRIVENGIKAGFESLRVGSTERDIWWSVAEKIASEGGDITACPWNVHAGRNSEIGGLPTTNTKIKRGDLVQFDVAISCQGYFGDITRNAIIGAPSQEMRSIQKIVLDAQSKAMEAIRPGVSAESVYIVARDEVKGKGHGKQLRYRLGHGIGLELHEQPFISPGNRIILEPGMVFTNEPNVLVPGKFGFQIEDIMLVTEDGYDVLSTLDRDMVQLA